MNQSKDHLGYVSTWFNSNMCEMQLFFSMAWLVLSYVSPKYGLERPKRRMRMLYSDGICMGYGMLFWIPSFKDHSDWRWSKYEWHWRWALRISRWTSNRMQLLPWWQAGGQQGGAEHQRHIALLDGLWNRRGLVEQFLTDWSIKSFQHWDNWNTRSEERVIILHFTFIIINSIFHLSLITVWLKYIS